MAEDKDRAPGAQKTEADYQAEIKLRDEKIEQQNAVVADLKNRLKAEKASTKQGNPTVVIDGVKHEITIPKSKHPVHGIITAEMIQKDGDLAKALLKETFGGLVPATVAEAARKKLAQDRIDRTRKVVDPNASSIAVS